MNFKKVDSSRCSVLLWNCEKEWTRRKKLNTKRTPGLTSSEFQTIGQAKKKKKRKKWINPECYNGQNLW